MTELNRASSLAPDLTAEALLPIREVVRLTGVNPVTLRAWERRYGLIRPLRTEGGHRLYSQADIETIRSIRAWTERGVAVSKVGSLLAQRTGGPVAVAATGQAWDEWLDRLREAVRHFDEPCLERICGQLFSLYPLSTAYQEILLPLWQALQREEGFGLTSQWLFLDTFLRGRALLRLQLAASTASEQVLLAAIPGHCRELELLVAGLLLGGDNGTVRTLAIGQPLEELGLVCQTLRPPALVLYSRRRPGTRLLRQLGRLALSLECPLALAGEASELAERSLKGSPIACLGSAGQLMAPRLVQFLAGHLDT